jgi:hypothetical protein
MNVDEERASSPLLGSASGSDRYPDTEDPDIQNSYARLERESSFEDDGTECENAHNGFKDVDDDQVQAEGEDVITSYIWMLVCCASISGLMFGESTRSSLVTDAHLSTGVDTAMLVVP